MFKQLVFLALGYGVQWITSPAFFGICGANDHPERCLLIRGGIVVAVWLLLNLMSGKGR